jgi:hypothetical protein
LTSAQELRKQIEDEELQADITRAIDTIQLVLDSANDAVDKEHLASAVADLANRVDDWKSLKVEGFGELLRFGSFTVLKGDSTKDTEREVCNPFFSMWDRILARSWTSNQMLVPWGRKPDNGTPLLLQFCDVFKYFFFLVLIVVPLAVTREILLTYTIPYREPSIIFIYLNGSSSAARMLILINRSQNSWGGGTNQQ